MGHLGPRPMRRPSARLATSPGVSGIPAVPAAVPRLALMTWPAVTMLGLAAGAAAALPYIACLRVGRPSVPRGVVALVASCALLGTAMALARALMPELLPSFSLSAVLSFLVVVVVCALRSIR